MEASSSLPFQISNHTTGKGVLRSFCPGYLASYFRTRDITLKHAKWLENRGLRVLSIMPKFPKILVQMWMEQFGLNGNFSVKVVHLQRWSSLTGRSSLTRNYCSIFRNFCFQSCSSLSLQTVVKMADGSVLPSSSLAMSLTSAVCVNFRNKT